MKILKGTKESGTNHGTEEKKQNQRMRIEIEIEIENKD
jgi:hypothetical protein